MNESSLKKLSKSQLIKLLLQQNAELQSRKPIPAPRKSVKQPTPKPRNKKPTPLPRTKIEQVDKALKGYTKSFEIGIKNNKDPLAQLQNTRKAIEYHIISILTSMKGLKFVETLRVTFKKLAKDEIVYKTAYFNSKPQTIINNTEIPEALQLSKEQILSMIAQWISEGSGWTVESVDNHYLNIVQYQPMKGSSYIKLPQELRHHRKGLITNFLTYYGLCNAIPQKWIRLLKESNPNTPTNSEYVGKIPLSKLSCKSASRFLISQKFEPPTAERRMLQANLDKQAISTIYNIPFKVTKDIRLAIFQFKIVHHILPTNATLFRDKIAQHDKCHLCDQKQTLNHLFVSCPNVQTFWQSFSRWWNVKMTTLSS